MKIRPYREEDFDVLVEFGRRFHKESRFNDIPIDVDLLRQLSANVLSSPFYAGWVAEEGDQIVGMMFGMVAPYFFSSKLHASDLLWYVVPEKRGTTIGVRLLKEYMEWSQNFQPTETYVAVNTMIAPEKTGKMLKRLGFTKVGEIYSKT